MLTRHNPICRLQETHFRFKGTRAERERDGRRHSLRMESNRTEDAVLTSHKVDFQSKSVPRDEEGHYVVIKQ